MKTRMKCTSRKGGDERSGLVCQVRSLNVPRARRPHVCMFHHPRPRQARLSDALGASSAAAHTKRRSRCATAPEVQVYRRLRDGCRSTPPGSRRPPLTPPPSGPPPRPLASGGPRASPSPPSRTAPECPGRPRFRRARSPPPPQPHYHTHYPPQPQPRPRFRRARSPPPPHHPHTHTHYPPQPPQPHY